jgi:hypothetical protein
LKLTVPRKQGLYGSYSWFFVYSSHLQPFDMKKNQGLAIVPLIVIIVLAGAAGFAIFSWVKTNKEAAEARVVAEQRESELKSVLEDAQQEAEENAKKAATLAETLAKTEEAMKLAEAAAKADAEEKAAMLADLESKLKAEEAAKAEADAKSEALAKEIASLETSMEEAKQREAILRASLTGGYVQVNPKAAAGLSAVSSSLDAQQSGLEKIKALLANATGPVATSELEALVRAYEQSLIESEQGAARLSRDLVASGDFSPSSTVGQAISDLQQTTQKQRAILNSLKALLASSGATVDPARVLAILSDLEASMVELEQRQASLDRTIAAESAAGATDGSAAMAEFQRSLQQSQNQLAALRRELAQAQAEKDAAIRRQLELEKLSIEIKYDIDYQARSSTYARRLHQMYNRLANPAEERQ